MKTLKVTTIGNRVLASPEYDDAHRAGFYDGLQGVKTQYPKTVNEYQRVYNLGFKSGCFIYNE